MSTDITPEAPPTNHLQRWRLILGSAANHPETSLSAVHQKMDAALAALYEDQNLSRQGGRNDSAPYVSQWLGDIRQYFPQSTVEIMQQDALERLNLTELLLHPEVLESVQADVHLVANLMALSSVIPENTKATARAVVKKVVDELLQKLEEPMRSAVSGAIDRSQRNLRPRHQEIDWQRTIRANLRHWQSEYRSIIPETLIGHGRKIRRPQREIVLAIDQSGSMANSIVYSAIFGAVMASLPTVSTKLVVFDTAVVDLTEQLSDPVEVLFGVQLGGGTDINKAIGYCQEIIQEPRNTILVLISDLYEGGVEANLLKRSAQLIASGVQMIALPALSNEGEPWYDKQLATKLAALGVPTFACTPDLFPDLMAAAIRREDVATWAANRGFKIGK